MVRNEVKAMIAQAGWTMTDVVKALNEKYGKDYTVQNLSNKLARGTLRYSEAKDIAEVIGYTISWVSKGK